MSRLEVALAVLLLLSIMGPWPGAPTVPPRLNGSVRSDLGTQIPNSEDRLTTSTLAATSGSAREPTLPSVIPWTSRESPAPLGAEIEAPASLIDSGRSFPIQALVTGGTPPYSDEWHDSLDHLYTGPDYAVVLSTLGNYSTTLYVLDAAGTLLSVNRTFLVVPYPTASVFADPPIADAGVPFNLTFLISGGVPPYLLRWGIDPNVSEGSRTLNRSGTFYEAAVALAPGPAWAVVGLTDSLGAGFAQSTPVATTNPMPNLTIAWAQAVGEVGLPVDLEGRVEGGSAPFHWSVIVQGPVQNATVTNGTLTSAGVLHWMSVFRTPQEIYVAVRITDAAGVGLVENTSLTVAAALGVEAAVNESDLSVGRPLNLTAIVSGGVPPYRYEIAVSGSVLSAGNFSGSSPLIQNWTPTTPGLIALGITVTDALGAVGNATLELAVSPNGTLSTPPVRPPSPLSSSGTTLGIDPLLLFGPLVAFVLICSVVGFVLLRRKKRHPTTPRTGPAVLSAVERILHEEDRVDRENVYLIAEDERLTTAEVDAAIDHWQHAGRIQIELGEEGREFLRWITVADTGRSEISEERNP